MTDGLSTLYQDLLGGSYDCVDRIVLNAYFRMGHDPGGFRVVAGAAAAGGVARSAKPSSGASISTRRACAASSKRCSLRPPHPTASPPPRWRLGFAHSASKTHYSTVPATLLMI